MYSFEKTKNWMYRNARPLDLARWRMHFEEGPCEDVLRALAGFQNPDGGFGHALEADNWNPNSTPLSTLTAINILFDLDSDNREARRMIDGILRYLDSGDGFSGGLWQATVESNNQFPRAPWWTHDPERMNSWGYNPSAGLAGFCLNEADKNSGLYEKAMTVAQNAVESFLGASRFDMHELPCFLALLTCAKKAGLDGKLKTQELAQKVLTAAESVIEKDTDKWKTEYICLPSDFIRTPESFMYPSFKALMEKELDLIESSCGSDGVWKVLWQWAGYEREFAISSVWWQGTIALQKTLLLKKFGRI